MEILKKMILAATLTSAVSCGLTELDSREPSSPIPPYLTDDSRVPVTYVIAFDFPQGYDWHSDPDYGSPGCNMLLYANGRKINKIPIGYQHHLLPEADMHRVLSGKIYSDYSDDDYSYILENGRELFRYPSREMIVAMDLVGEDIYTLGCSRSGSGFSARKNGQLLVASASGSPFPRTVVSADGDYSFCYSEAVVSESEMSLKYYCYSTLFGKKELVLAKDLVKLWDAIPGVGYLASLSSSSSPVLIKEGAGIYPISLGVSESSININTCRFLSKTPPFLFEIAMTCRPYIVGSIPSPISVRYRGVWKEDSCILKLENNRKPYGFVCNEDGFLFGLASGNSSSTPDIAVSGLMSYSLPDSYAAISESAVSVRSDSLVVGLTSRSGEKPLIWSPHCVDTLDINGFISEVKLEMVEKTQQP